MRIVYRDIVGAFIFSADNKLLLGKGGVYADAWIVPGGGIEEGEAKYDAISREIAEETGIDIGKGLVQEINGAITGESGKTLRDTGEQILVKMTFYNFTVKLPLAADKIVLRTDDDFKEARWVPVSELPHIQLSPPSITTLKN